MRISEYLMIGGFSIGCISAFIAVLTYMRTKRQEFENRLYHLKLDALANCTYYMEQYFIQMESSIHYSKKLNQGKEKFDRRYVQDLNIGLEKSTFEVYSQVLKQTVYFQKDVIAAAKDFVHNAFFDFTDDLPTDNNTCIKIMEDHYQEQIVLGNKLNDLMRNSMHLDKIDQSLFKRSK
jgi:hypothetical protein